MATTEKRTSTIILDGKQPARTIKELAADIRILSNHLKKLDKDSDAFKSGAGKLRALKQEMGEANTQMRNVSNGWSRFWKTVKATAAGVMLGNILTNLTTMLSSVIPKLIEKNTELADSYADIRKTTGLTEDQVKSLDKTLSSFNTRTPKKELRELAVEAGRLGIEGVNNIAGFVKAADQIKVALGDDLGGDAAGNIRIVGKLTEQFNVAAREGVNFEQAMLKTGSAINELSASGSTQADFLVNFTRRVSGVATQADITIDKILAIAATLDEAGQNVEVSGTTVSKVLVKMFTDTEIFADIAGESVTDFTKLLNTDANAALMLFLKGLNGNNEGLTELATKLEDADLEGARATAVLASLANNTDKLADKLKISNQALTEGTSLTNEFNIKNDNLAGTWDKIKKSMAAVWLNKTFSQAARGLVGIMADLVGVNRNVNTETEVAIGNIKQEQVQFNDLMRQIMNTNIPQERRKELIEQVNTQYKDYLPNLIDEGDSLEELSGILETVNKQMSARILAIQFEQDMKDHYARTADAARAVVGVETAIANLRDPRNKKFADINTAGLVESLNVFKESNQIMVDDTEETTAEIEQRFRLMAQRMQVAWDDVLGMKTTGGGPKSEDDDTPTGSTSKMSKKDIEKLEKELKKAKEAYAQFLEQLNKLDEDNWLKTLSKDEQDIARLNAKYDEQIEQLQEFLADKTITQAQFDEKEKLINQMRHEEMLVLEAKAQEKLKEDKAKFIEEVDELTMTEIEKVAAKYDEMIRLATEYGLAVEELERLKEEAITEILDEESEKRNETRRKEFQKTVDQINQIAGRAMDIMNALNALADQNTSQRIQSLDRAKEKKLAILEEERERGVLTEDEYNKKYIQIQEDHEQATKELQLQQFKRQKATSLAQAIIQGAVAFMQALASGPPPMNIIQAGLVGALSGIQIAAIAKQQPPEFEKGGIITSGPRHSSGGMPLYDPATGRKQAELEGGEAILSRETVANNYGVVKELLESSMSGIGASIPQFNYGGMFNAAQPAQSIHTSSTLDASEFKAAIKEMKVVMSNMQAKVVFSRDLIQSLRENIKEHDRLDSSHY